MKKTIIIFLLFFNYLNSFSQQTGTFIDPRDGKTYKTVKIGNQVWMAENLAFKMDSGCWTYNNDTINISHFGYLYDWSAANYACPAGWHLPTKSNFETLLNSVGGKGETAYRALIPSGNSKFSAQCVGWRVSNGNFYYMGKNTSFWSSSLDYDKNQAWHLGVSSISSEARVVCNIRSCGFSVRCLKDN